MRVCTRVYGKTYIEFTTFTLCSLFVDQKCVIQVGGKLNNVVKMDLAPFGIKLFNYSLVISIVSLIVCFHVFKVKISCLLEYTFVIRVSNKT